MNNLDFMSKLGLYLKLENLRPIFDFIKTIDMRCDIGTVYKGLGGLKKRYTKIDEFSYYITKNIISTCYKDGKLLFQNPLANSIEFWNQYYSKEKINSASDYPRITIANMLNYFRCINLIGERIKNEIKPDDLPYIYEDICFSICDMTNSNCCYFLYTNEHSVACVLSQSGFTTSGSSRAICEIYKEYSIKKAVDKDDSDGSITDISEIIEGIEVFWHKNKKQEIKQYVIIRLPLDSFSSEIRREFLVVLEMPNQEESKEQIICIASKILFMQERLLTNIQKDYATLLNIQSDYGYIKSVRNDFNGSVSILHVSDLHIDLDERWNVDSTEIERITTRIIENQNSKNVDLIAVTGDVVNASNNADEAQKKYDKAGAVLFCIAKKLWGYATERGDNVLPNDWKKRIIITTGNHDYAAMNDVVVQTKSRVIKSAEPSYLNPGTMSKFTYFLEFIQKFLDMSIAELINNNLNELRFYRNLKLNIIVLNTSSPANSLQNNKVGLSEKHVSEISNRLQSSHDNSIILAHHSPLYQINYMEDIYTPYNLFSMDKNGSLPCNLYVAFQELVEQLDNNKSFTDKALFEKMKKLIEAYNDIKRTISNTQRTQNLKSQDLVDAICYKYSIKKPKKQHVALWIREFCESDLFLDIERIIQYYQESVHNEFSHKLYDKLRNIKELNAHDDKEFKSLYEKLVRNNESICAVLSGHIHQNDNKSDYLLNPKKGRAPVRVFVVHKLEQYADIVEISPKGIVSNTFVNTSTDSI